MIEPLDTTPVVPLMRREEVSREALRARLDALRMERQRRFDDVNAFNGAIQEAEYWFAVLDAREDMRIVPEERQADSEVA